MDFRVFVTTFVTIFLAELGDRTQMAAFALGATTKDIKAVFLGTFFALIIAVSLGVFAGKFLGQHINPQTMRLVSGTLFVAIGVLLLLDKMPK